MAQTIKHRRGSISSVRNITSFGEAEIVIGSGSVDSKVVGPVVYIGKPGGTTAANDYVPISKMYVGSGLPSITPAQYGTTLDGLPYYDTTNKKIYILGANADGTSGHTEISITSASIENFNSVVVSALPDGTVSGSSQISFLSISDIPSGIVSSSTQITNVITDSYISASAAASGFGSGGGASVGGIFIQTGSVYATTNDLEVTGSINATNINAGTPTSNAWQTNLEGSYFNNFTKDTDVSEILRFVAGLLSSSAANPTANTKTYSSISENKSLGATSNISGYIPQDQDINDVQYLIDNGFAAVGGTIFPGKTIYTSTTPLISYSSVAGGSTSVQSSADSQLFGLGGLSSGAGTEFRVSGSHSFSFYQSQTAIDGDTATETSESSQILSNSTLDTTSNGVTLGKIQTVNPAVIPAAFQDGKFATVFSKNLVDWTSELLTSVSASGQYKISTTIGIGTGSQSDYTTKSADETIFWAPISTITSNLGSQTLSYSGDTTTALTATSGSISGAPYLSGGTWNLVVTMSGLFEPLYAASTTLGDVIVTNPSANGSIVVSNTSGVDTLSTSGGDVSTANAVYGSDGTVRSTGTHPFRTDDFIVDAVYTISGTGNTFDESGFTDTEFNLAVKGRNRLGSQSTLVTKNVAIHTAGDFGQIADSGSMGYFGGGTSSPTGLAETFLTESYRRVIGSPTALTTTWDKEASLTLGNGGDLQVKPGYLVNPESANGYWYPTGNYNSAHYKWYLREFTTGAGANASTLRIDLDPDTSADLTTFDDTTANKIAVGVIFESQLPANSGDSRTTIFDVVKGNASYGGSYDNQSSDNQLNPFSGAVDLQGDFSSLTNSSGTLTVGLTNAIGQTINATYDKVWVLIRYTGTPSNTLEGITVSLP